MKMSQAKGVIYSTKTYFNRKSLILIYYSLAYSIFTQSIIFYGKTFNIHLNQIKILMNNILRTILNIKRDENFNFSMPTNTMYYKLKILKFDDVCNYFLITLLRKALFYEPTIFEKYFINFIPSHSHNTRGTNLNLPPIRLENQRNFTIFRSLEAF